MRGGGGLHTVRGGGGLHTVRSGGGLHTVRSGGGLHTVRSGGGLHTVRGGGGLPGVFHLVIVKDSISDQGKLRDSGPRSSIDCWSWPTFN